jgi:hypothetical protein
MPDDLDQVASGSPKNVQITGMRVAAKRLPNLKRQPVHAAAHVGSADCHQPPRRAASLDPVADPNPVATGQLDLDQIKLTDSKSILSH